MFRALLLTCVAAAARAECPPKVELTPAWTECKADADCVLAGDACRSCGNFLPVNVKFRAEATKQDAQANQAAKCVRSCEACSAALVKLTCTAGQCRASPASK